MCRNDDRVQLFDETEGCYFDYCKYQAGCTGDLQPGYGPNMFQLHLPEDTRNHCQFFDAHTFNEEAILAYENRV